MDMSWKQRCHDSRTDYYRRNPLPYGYELEESSNIMIGLLLYGVAILCRMDMSWKEISYQSDQRYRQCRNPLPYGYELEAPRNMDRIEG